MDDNEKIVRFITGSEAAVVQNLTSGAWTPITPQYDCWMMVTGSNGYAMIATSNQSLTRYTFDRCDVTSSSVCYATSFVRKGQTVYVRASGTNTAYAMWKLETKQFIQCIKYI